jgi:hypothetical protein
MLRDMRTRRPIGLVAKIILVLIAAVYLYFMIPLLLLGLWLLTR